MKKAIIIFLSALALLLSVTSCDYVTAPGNEDIEESTTIGPSQPSGAMGTDTSTATDTESSESKVDETDRFDQDNSFEFSYELTKNTYRKGESFNLAATVKNVSGKDHVYMGSYGEFRAQAIFVYQDNIILPDDIGMTNEFREYTVSNGESRSVTYTFRIPENTPTGVYSLKLSYGDETIEIANAIEIAP